MAPFHKPLLTPLPNKSLTASSSFVAIDEHNSSYPLMSFCKDVKPTTSKNAVLKLYVSLSTISTTGREKGCARISTTTTSPLPTPTPVPLLYPLTVLGSPLLGGLVLSAVAALRSSHASLPTGSVSSSVAIDIGRRGASATTAPCGQLWLVVIPISPDYIWSYGTVLEKDLASVSVLSLPDSFVQGTLDMTYVPGPCYGSYDIQLTYAGNSWMLNGSTTNYKDGRTAAWYGPWTNATTPIFPIPEAKDPWEFGLLSEFFEGRKSGKEF
ncbi:hypothetical protein BU16DRAFT_580375 [Lophium mytilinum]|uniref:Uncharacterized protein n=1 Tax=Lophium mytilinum TaxID=390894 RepID=A0A6A6R305_9PEZI|nr:hypothetical protein BU16DRAFT_580375 [Lophium mytilinum]